MKREKGFEFNFSMTKPKDVVLERSKVFNSYFCEQCRDLELYFRIHGYGHVLDINDKCLDDFIDFNCHILGNRTLNRGLLKSCILTKLYIAFTGTFKYDGEDYHDKIFNKFTEYTKRYNVYDDIIEICKDVDEENIDNVYTNFIIIALKTSMYSFNRDMKSILDKSIEIHGKEKITKKPITIIPVKDEVMDYLYKAREVVGIEDDMDEILYNLIYDYYPEKELKLRIHRIMTLSDDRDDVKRDFDFIYNKYKDEFPYKGKLYHGVSRKHDKQDIPVEEILKSYKGYVSFTKSEAIAHSFAIESHKEYGYILETEGEGLDIEKLILSRNEEQKYNRFMDEQEVLIKMPEKYNSVNLMELQLKDRDEYDRFKYQIYNESNKPGRYLLDINCWFRMNGIKEFIVVQPYALTRDCLLEGKRDKALDNFGKLYNDKIIILMGDRALYDFENNRYPYEFVKNNNLKSVYEIDEDYEGFYSIHIYKNDAYREFINRRNNKLGL